MARPKTTLDQPRAFLALSNPPGECAAMPPRRTMTKPEVKAFLEALALARPDPQTELAYTDAYTLLVAVALSAQGD